MTELAFVIFAENPELYAEGLKKDFSLSLKKEKHGKGPEHWSGYYGTQLFEIYPPTKDRPNGTFGTAIDGKFHRLEIKSLKLLLHLIDDYDWT